MTMKSKRFKLNLTDFIKGVLVASLSGGMVTMYQGLQTGNPDFNQVGMTAIASGVGYICKNFFEGK